MTIQRPISLTNALLLPEAAATWPQAQALYAQAVEVAIWADLPINSIVCYVAGWFFGGVYWSEALGGGWSWRDPEKSMGWFIDAGFKFMFNNSDEAKDAGLMFGKWINNEGEIGPYLESPEGIAGEQAIERARWEDLDRMTAPTPISQLAGAARRRAAKEALQTAKSAVSASPFVF